MAWFTRITRFGDAHFVFGQEQDMTCGPSCALMCYTKITKLTPGMQMYATTQRIKDHYAQWLGSPYDGSVAGTWPDGLAHALNRMNCGRWTTTNVQGNRGSTGSSTWSGSLAPSARRSTSTRSSSD